MMLNVMASSRASSLPHWICVVYLFDHPPSERIPIRHAVIGFYTRDDRQHQPADGDQAEQEEPDNHQHQKERDGCGNGDGDLKIQRLLALRINERVTLALHLPENQWTNQRAKRNPDPQQGGQVTKHSPLTNLLARLGQRQLLVTHGVLLAWNSPISQPEQLSAIRRFRSCLSWPVPASPSALPAGTARLQQYPGLR